MKPVLSTSGITHLYSQRKVERSQGKDFFGEKNWVVLAFSLPLTYKGYWGREILSSLQLKREELQGCPTGVKSEAWYRPKKTKERLSSLDWESGEGQGCACLPMTGTGMCEFPQGPVDSQKEAASCYCNGDTRQENCLCKSKRATEGLY